MAREGVAMLDLAGELDPFPACLLCFFALCLNSVRSVSVLPTLSATCTITPSLSSVISSPSCTGSPAAQCMSPMKFLGTSYTMTRLLKV